MSTGMHSVPQSTSTAAPSRASVVEFLATAFWLIFLFVPVLMVWYSPVELGWKLVAWLSIACFGVAYLISFHRTDLVASFPRWLNLLAWTVLMGLLLAPAMPALGVNVIATLPYFVGLFCFHLPLRAGLWTGAIIGAAAILVAGALGGSLLKPEAFWGQFIGISLAVVFLLLMRMNEAREESAAAVRTELALLRDREAVARDVHDILGHSLTVIAVKTELAARLMQTDPARAHAELTAVQALTRTALADVRSTVTELRGAPDFASQLAASTDVLRAAGITTVLEGDPAAPPQGAVFGWALRELTTNVVRHANAESVTIAWGPASLTVSDDGDGIGDAPAGNGLSGLHTRAADVAATVRIDPALRGATRPGTRVEVRRR